MVAESITPRGLGFEGAYALDVAGSERCWTYFHEAYCVTVVRRGSGRWRYRRRDADVSPRVLMLMEPGDVHATTAVSSPGDFMAMFFPSTLINELVEHFELRDPHFRSIDPGCPSLVRPFLGLADATRAGVAPEEQREQVSLCMARLFAGAGERTLRKTLLPLTRVRKAARLLRERFEAAPWETINVGQIASDVGMSYHWLVHSFTHEYGVPPYHFVQALRLAHVRALLARGPCAGVRSLADVALSAGYSDKSHLHRCVKRHHGLSPGQLAAQLHAGWRRSER